MLVRLQNNRGMTLVAILVAAAVASIVGLAFTGILDSFFRGMSSIEAHGEVMDAKQLIRNRLSCQRTFPTGMCPSNQPILLKDELDRDLFPATQGELAPFDKALKLGRARIQTVCHNGV